MQKIPTSIIFVCIFLFCTSPIANSQPLTESALRHTVVTDKLSHPWSLAFLPRGEYLVTERSGKLRTVNKQGVVSAPIQGLPSISAVGQGGLLDVVLHPEFISNSLVYLSYVAGDAKIGFSTEVLRATLSPLTSAVDFASPSKAAFESSLKYVLTNPTKVFVALPKTQGSHHFGGRLAFDKAGYLFISLGDRGARQNSQDLQTHHGSIIRLHDNGDIPKDNPFVNNASALPEIYSYGHRNVQGLAAHPVTGNVWSHEHGPQGGDEVNKPMSGKNYGWPVITYGAEYGSGQPIGRGVQADGMEQPTHYWTPSIAPSGMAFFDDSMLVGSLKYRLLAVLSTNEGALEAESTTSTANSTINRVQPSFSETRLFENSFGRIRDVRTRDRQTFYLLTDAGRGKLIRVTKITQ
jgi:glucose/arabinose dehydrogenase